MSASTRNSREERKAQAAAIKAAQEAADRRRRRLIVLVTAVVAAALIVPVAIVVANRAQESARLDAAAQQPIEGEKEVDVPSAGHVSGDVTYETATPTPTPGDTEAQGTALPPVGGDHDPTPQNCGFYDQPVRDENAVHSLEHGAVWLAYHSDLSEADVARPKEIAHGDSYVLASPYTDLAAPLVATAWGVQLELESADDERLDAFLVRYVQGEQTPEPGAPCSGGVGTPVV